MESAISVENDSIEKGRDEEDDTKPADLNKIIPEDNLKRKEWNDGSEDDGRNCSYQSDDEVVHIRSQHFGFKNIKHQA